MTYTKLKFRESTYLPGFGQVSELADVEVAPSTPDEPTLAYTVRLKGPSGIVTVPWSAISFAFQGEVVQKFTLVAGQPVVAVVNPEAERPRPNFGPTQVAQVVAREEKDREAAPPKKGKQGK